MYRSVCSETKTEVVEGGCKKREHARREMVHLLVNGRERAENSVRARHNIIGRAAGGAQEHEGQNEGSSCLAGVRNKVGGVPLVGVGEGPVHLHAFHVTFRLSLQTSDACSRRRNVQIALARHAV